jgi:excisionase family DNA binding protein
MKAVQDDRGAGNSTAVDRLLTKIEAADRLNVAPRFVERCIVQRRIRFVRVGRFIRVPESAIDEFVEAGTVDVRGATPSRPGFRRFG